MAAGPRIALIWIKAAATQSAIDFLLIYVKA